MQSDAKNVDEYLASLPEDRRTQIAEVRRLILDRLPDGYEETMNWGMICYQVPLSVKPDTYNGQPLMYAALGSQKHHMALYLTGIYMDEKRRADLEQRFVDRGKKLDAGKSCLRFERIDDLALDVIGDCIAADAIDDFVARFDDVRSARKQTSTKTKSTARKKKTAARKKRASGRRTK